MGVTETPERVLARIRKLLAVAEHPNTEETEAEAYLGQAMALMAKYGVERALLADAGESADAVDVSEIELRTPYKVEKGLLLNVVAMALRCRMVTSRRYCETSGRFYQMARIVGYESDRERVSLLFASLLVQMFGALGRTPVPREVAAITFRKSFCHGYIMRIRQRLVEAEERAAREAEASAGSAASEASRGRGATLVLRDREREVEARFADLFPDVRTGRPYRRSLRGASDGVAAANRADIGGPRIGGPAQRSLPKGQ